MKTHGIEVNPYAFLTIGRIGWQGNSKACQWVRVGRLRLIVYWPRIARPLLESHAEGWQITVWKLALSWTYATQA